MLSFAAGVPAALKSPGVGEALSGVFGSVSLTAWICLLLPQLITNYKAKSAEAISMKFLLIWLAGDIANLSGALFTSLAPSTIALATYFCINDLILISQCTYYNTLNARRRARRAAHLQHHPHHHHRRPSTSDPSSSSSAAPPPTETDPLLETTRPTTHHRRRPSGLSAHTDPLTRIITGEGVAGEDGTGNGRAAWVTNVLSLVAVWVVGVSGWFVSYKMGAWTPGDSDGVGDGGNSGGGGGDLIGEEPVKMVGMVLGYGSAVLYLCARIPQIIKNYREKSCEGLALLFFLLSLTGNFTYGASLVAYSQDWGYFVRALPWLLGSLGTMVEDCIIFVQFRIYSPERTAKAGGTV